MLSHHIYERQRAGARTGSLEAAILSLDIAGFTTTSQALMAYGKQGAETLAELLNHAFAPAVQAIYERSGFVTHFAGDGLLALFSADAEGVAQAIAAAQVIQDQFTTTAGHYTTPLTHVSLTARTGVAVGSVTWGITGPADHPIWFFRGPVISRAVQAQKEAQPGVVGLESGVELLLPLPAVQPRPVVPGEETAAIPSFIAEDPHQPWIGEFRSVATVFLNIRALDDPAVLDSLITLVSQVAKERGGHLAHLEFREASTIMMLTFGAPAGHENDVERALSTVETLLERLPAVGLTREQGRAGLTFGTVYAGMVGSSLRHAYTTLGEVVNLAERLMGEAGWGEALVSEVVAQTPGYSFTPLGLRPYKGFVQPVPTFAWHGRTATAGNLFTTPLVGRQQELGQLLNFCRPLGQEGRYAGVVFLYGEAGIGKSHLAAALRAALGAQVTWLTAASDAILPAAFHPFSALLRHLDRAAGGLPAYLESLLALLPNSAAGREMAAEVKRRQSVLLTLAGRPETGSFYDQLDARGRYENSLIALKNWLLAESLVRPLILEIEDGQWLDDASQTLLTSLTRNVAAYPLGLLVTARYADDGARPTFPLAPDTPSLALDLAGLPSAALAELGQNLLGGPLTAEVQTFLQERAGANPFFSQQLLTYARESNLLRLNDDGFWILDQEAVHLPTSITVLLVARIDRLARQVREVVQTAAVLGQEFELLVLSTMLGADVRPDVAQAAQAQIWLALNELRYLFKHALLRDAAYEMQLPSRLQNLHSLAAGAYERLYTADLKPYYRQLAYHYGAAGNVAQERHYSQQAGEQAAAQFDYPTALRYYGRALSLTPAEDCDGQATILLEREKIYDVQGRRQEQAAELERIAELIPCHSDGPFIRATFALRQARLAQAEGRFEAADEWLAKATVESQRASQPALLIETYLVLAALRRFQGQYDLSRLFSEKARELARATQQTLLEASSLRLLGQVHEEIRRLDEAAAFFQEALALYQQLDERRGTAATYSHLGNMAWFQQDWPTAEARYRQGLALQEVVGDRSIIGTLLNNLSMVVQKQGRLDEAEQYAQRSLAVRREIGDRLGEGSVLANMGAQALQRAHHQAAIAYYRQALAIHEQIGYRRGVAIQLYNLGMLHYFTDNLPESEQAERRALAEARAIGFGPIEELALIQLGQCLLDQEQLAEAALTFEEAIMLGETANKVSLSASGRAGLAEVRLRQQNPAEAHVTLAPALATLSSDKLAEEMNVRTYLAAYWVLQAVGDRQGEHLLQLIDNYLQGEVSRLSDEADRIAFWQHNQLYRMVAALLGNRDGHR